MIELIQRQLAVPKEGAFMVLRRRSVMAAAAFFVLSLSRLAYSATVSAQHTKPAPDCQIVNPCSDPNQSCQLRGGHCSDSGEDGENGYKDPNHDGCGCQM